MAISSGGIPNGWAWSGKRMIYETSMLIHHLSITRISHNSTPGASTSKAYTYNLHGYGILQLDNLLFLRLNTTPARLLRRKVRLKHISEHLITQLHVSALCCLKV